MKGLKKYLGIIVGIVLAITLLPSMPVYASGKVVVAVSASSLNIGDTVTVTATAQGPGGEQTTATLGFNYDSSKLSFVGCSDSTYAGGGGGYVGVVGEKASITLKATASGKASVSVSGSDGVIFSSGEEIGSLSAGGTTITVNNAAGNADNNQSGSAGSADNNSNNSGSSNNSNDSNNSNSGNSDNTGSTNNTGDTDNTDNAKKSGDNSLSSLSISPGKISPAFQYSTTNYTASVGADVNEVAVDAKTSNAKATVESVSGNTNLKEGQNTISIVVKAENGTTATYKIVVTKEAGASEPEEEPKEEEPKEEEPKEEEPQEENKENPEAITLNGHAFNLADTIPADKIPEDFTKTTIKCKGKDVEALKFNQGEVVLVYLTTPSTEVKNTLALYDEKSGAFSPFIKIPAGSGYYIILNPPAETGLSGTYTVSNIEIGGYSGIPAYGSQEEGRGDFCLVYAVSKGGNTGWYQYDKTEGTLQRYVPSSEKETADVDKEAVNADIKGLKNSYDKLNEQYTKEKDFARKTIAVLIFLLAVLVVVIVNLILHKKRKEEKWEDDFSEKPERFHRKEEEQEAEEEEELEEEEAEEVRPQRRTPERRTPEERAPQKKAPEQKQPEQRVPEKKRPEQKQPEQRIPKKRPEQKQPEQRIPEREKPQNDFEDKDDFEVINLEDL